jgi:hypothetical protein
MESKDINMKVKMHQQMSPEGKIVAIVGSVILVLGVIAILVYKILTS